MQKKPILVSNVAAIMVVASFYVSSACNQHSLKPVIIKRETIVAEPLPIVANRDVDVLFVIDDSFSMGEEQGLLAKNFSKFIQVLERPDVKANYRIGITTSDFGHNKCDSDDSLRGEFRLESCTERLDDFVEPYRRIYRRNTACLQECELSPEELAIRKTEIEKGGEKKIRPWIENQEGITNFDTQGVSVAKAFACLGPQGINGCGYEGQLESLYGALKKSKDPGSDQFGFIRDNAILAVIIVTDEADCSSDPQYQAEVWSQNNSVFWTSEDSGVSSAVCWNAGVSCQDGPGNEFGQCDPLDHLADGTPVLHDEDSSEDTGSTDEMTPGESVLYPLSRYTKLLDDIEAAKKAINPDQEIIVALIGGVTDTGEVNYPKPKTDESASKEERDFANNFGIGWGCRGSVTIEEEMNDDLGQIEPRHEEFQYAVPPVRLRKFVEHYNDDPRSAMFSVCDGERYDDALETIARSIEAQIKPACYKYCPEDMNPASSVLVPLCTVTEFIDGRERTMSECVNDGQGDDKRYAWDIERDDYVIPEGDEACYVLLVDSNGSTQDDQDDLSNECSDEGYALEFKIIRVPGMSEAIDELPVATCSISSAIDLDCPGFPSR